MWKQLLVGSLLLESPERDKLLPWAAGLEVVTADIKEKGCLSSPIPSAWSCDTTKEEKASPCHHLLHKVCSFMTGQELWPSWLLKACSRQQTSCPQHQSGLMNSGQMLLPQQLGLLQDKRQDGARSEQSSELDCLGAVLTPCDPRGGIEKSSRMH